MPNGWHRKNENTAAHHARRKQYTSPEHRRHRQAGQRLVDAGRAVCWRCHQPIPPGSVWHVGHDDHDRRIVRGTEHATCNLHAAAQAGARARNHHTTHSRAW